LIDLCKLFLFLLNYKNGWHGPLLSL